jgi:hypothetical protein
MRLIVWLILRVLWFNECLYLYATGWRRKTGDWTPPAKYPFARKDPYTHGHAVNAQKQINRFPPRRK